MEDQGIDGALRSSVEHVLAPCACLTRMGGSAEQPRKPYVAVFPLLMALAAYCDGAEGRMHMCLRDGRRFGVVVVVVVCGVCNCDVHARSTRVQTVSPGLSLRAAVCACAAGLC